MVVFALAAPGVYAGIHGSSEAIKDLKNGLKTVGFHAAAFLVSMCCVWGNQRTQGWSDRNKILADILEKYPP